MFVARGCRSAELCVSHCVLRDTYSTFSILDLVFLKILKYICTKKLICTTINGTTSNIYILIVDFIRGAVKSLIVKYGKESFVVPNK